MVYAHGYLDFGLVADGHRGVPERLPVAVGRLLFRGPERRPVVEVEDRDVREPVLEGCEGPRTARLVGEAPTGCPEQRHGRDRVEVEVFDRQIHVGGPWLAVEQDREVVGRVDLTECQGRPQLWVS